MRICAAKSVVDVFTYYHGTFQGLSVVLYLPLKTGAVPHVVPHGLYSWSSPSYLGWPSM